MQKITLISFSFSSLLTPRQIFSLAVATVVGTRLNVMAEGCKSGARETKASTHPASLTAAMRSDGAGGDKGIKDQ